MPRILLISACLGCLALAGPVWAADEPLAAVGVDASPSLAAQDGQGVTLPKVDATTASDELLGDLHGKGTAILTEQDLTAVNTGNTISAGVVGSGAISLQDSAFSDFGGVGNVIMNTGHNNNLQSTVSVTIVMPPPAAIGP